MKVHFPTAIALALIALLAGVSVVRAQDDYAPVYDVTTANGYASKIETLEGQLASLRSNLGGGVDACDVCDDGPGCGPAIYMETELLFLRYHKGEGVRVGTDAFEDVEFEYEASPRFTVGYVGESGLGWRARWFDFQHGAAAAERGGSVFTVDSYSVDLETFERFQLNDKWDIEVSGGSRYFGFEETHRDIDAGVAEIRQALSWGFGGIVGIEARKRLRRNWSLYGRARLAVIGGDRWYINNLQQQPAGPIPGLAGTRANGNVKTLDFWSPQLEISAGSEYSRILSSGTEIFFRYGGEWITYYNVSATYDDFASAATAGAAEMMHDPDDAGYGGFGFSFGIYR